MNVPTDHLNTDKPVPAPVADRQSGLRWRRMLVLYLLVPYLCVTLIFTVFQRRLIYRGARSEPLDVSLASFAGGHSQNVALQVAEDVTIRGWLLRAKSHATPTDAQPAPSAAPQRRLVIYFAGNAQHRHDRETDLHQFLAAGVDVLACDYRGFGDSQGTPTETNLTHDAAAVWEYAISAGYQPSQIIVYGESLGGAVAKPTVVPVRLTSLTLDEALAAAGGISTRDTDFASIRIYRDGTLYQIPLEEYLRRGDLQKTRLINGDSIFVDTEFELERAQAYFEEQIRLAEFRQRSRTQALNELNAEVSLRRASLEESRSNFRDRAEFDAVDRDYVYLSGEVTRPGRFEMPFGRQATLADAIYSESGFSAETANPSQIYVLRGSSDPADFGAVTAWHLDARNAANLTLATDFRMQPNDIVFIAEQPITRWNRAFRQIFPLLISSANVATN